MENWQMWLVVACILNMIELTILNSRHLLAVGFGASLVVLSAFFDASSTNIHQRLLMFILGFGLGVIIIANALLYIEITNPHDAANVTQEVQTAMEKQIRTERK